MKYVVCIGARAKDQLDQFRVSNGLGRFPLRNLVHKNYFDNRPTGARRGDMFSTRIRPVTVQTNLVDTKLVDLLDLVDTIDIVTKHDTTDQMLMSHILGTFLDAVIMGDLIDTSAEELIEELKAERGPLIESARLHIARRASQHNLRTAAAKGNSDGSN